MRKVSRPPWLTCISTLMRTTDPGAKVVRGPLKLAMLVAGLTSWVGSPHTPARATESQQ
jgi:hypothetical protein